MIILDENIIVYQSWRLSEMNIRHRQIGRAIGRQGMKDREQIIPLLHRLRHPTFFTRDIDYYKSDLCHANYSLVYLIS